MVVFVGKSSKPNTFSDYYKSVFWGEGGSQGVQNVLSMFNNISWDRFTKLNMLAVATNLYIILVQIIK